MLEIPDLVILQVQLHIQIEEVEDLLWYQTDAAMDILIAMQGIGIGVLRAHVLGRQSCDIGQIALGTQRALPAWFASNWRRQIARRQA